ncbi:MAG: hypothetical protein OXN17_15535 [Candidatus Poribacteria bacterium]|nr:hypothetical protein [Candidatus Poribacteria bacterium]
MKSGKAISTIALLSLVAVPAGFAHIINLESGLKFQYSAELVEVSPVIDGILNDTPWHETGIPGKMEQEVIYDEQWQESSDFTGLFTGVWRSGFLYIAVQLTDDHVENFGAKLSEKDHLVVYLDPDHSGHKSDLYRYDLPVGEDERQSFVPPLRSVAWGDDGLSCELMFYLGDIAEKGNSVGFWIYYNDVDNGRLEHRISWGPPGYTYDDLSLPDLVFTAKLKPHSNQKILQWGRIKSFYY